jgi:hypothetical protein
MKRQLWILALCDTLLASAAPVWSQDGFYAVPTRVAPGTCITSPPYTITKPGSYFLNRNFTYTGSGIAITSPTTTSPSTSWALT